VVCLLVWLHRSVVGRLSFGSGYRSAGGTVLGDGVRAMFMVGSGEDFGHFAAAGMLLTLFLGCR